MPSFRAGFASHENARKQSAVESGGGSLSHRQSKSCISAASQADGVDLDLPFHLRLGRVAWGGGGAPAAEEPGGGGAAPAAAASASGRLRRGIVAAAGVYVDTVAAPPTL